MSRRLLAASRWTSGLALPLTLLLVYLTIVGGGRADTGRARILVKFQPAASAQDRRAVLAASGAQEQSRIPDIGTRVVSVPSGAAAAALEQLRSSPEVQFAETDTLLQPQETLPSDPSFPQQYAVGGGAWGWYQTRTTQAWDITTGDRSVVIAILDTGLKTSGLDDFSGQVVAGWNVLDNTTDTSSSAGTHGTYVAGAAGLALDNGIGNAGFCPGCRIMPVQVGTDSGAYLSDLASGLTWAADHGARVANMSWGGPSNSSTLQDAINYAHSKNLVITAAAGNSNCDCITYPAADQNIIGVAGTDSSGNKAGDSNYGSWVTVAAPEGNMTAWPTINGAPGYAPVGGTSLAAPVVAGVAGLLFSANPGLSNTQVERAMEQTATPVGFSVASGRVDTLAALQSLGFSDPQPSSLPVNGKGPQILAETNGDWNATPLAAAPQPGQVLLRGQGSWSGSAPLSLSSIKWLRCDAGGANCTTVGTSAKYTVMSTDAGFTLELLVTVKNSLGATTAGSALSQPVGSGGSGGTTSPPTNTALPAISGTAQDGQGLVASTGSWSGSPTGYSYQWQRCDASASNCGAITGATASSYSLTPADVGSTVAVQVTASNAAGSASATSAPTSAVAAAPPQNTSAPTVTGTGVAGQTLQTSTGFWTGTTPLSYAYQWQRCDSSGANCSDISGATASSYLLTSSDVGATMRAKVSASNSAGSATAVSRATAAITGGTQHLGFSGTLSKTTTSLAFPVTIGPGEADALLSFGKTAPMTLQLLSGSGAVVAQISGRSSPLGLKAPGLTAGSYRYVVSSSGVKGSISFTLAVTAPSP